jgi:membrane-bound ClpP family serine protease
MFSANYSTHFYACATKIDDIIFIENMKSGRFIIAVITNLLDEAIIVAIILWGLPRLGVHIPLWGTILICIGFIIYAVLFYIIGSSALIKRPVPGFTDMVSMEGQAISRLNPNGMVKVASELWSAHTDQGPIESGERIFVIKQKGFKLLVRRR